VVGKLYLARLPHPPYASSDRRCSDFEVMHHVIRVLIGRDDAIVLQVEVLPLRVRLIDDPGL
jgi:hypothetical protein